MPDNPPEIDFLRFLPYPRIVAVDNKQDELDSITKGLFNMGLPCIPIIYNRERGLMKPSRWHSERLRLVFLDLNLSEIEAGQTPSRIVDSIAEVLTELDPKGPYLIIFWTRFREMVKETMQLLVERNFGAPLPFGFSIINKSPFLAKPDGLHDLGALRSAILSALKIHKLFLAMLAWESEVKNSAVLTFNTVHGLVANPQADGRAQNDQDLRDVLKNLAKAAWGTKNAKEKPVASITSGLAPLLLDNLDSNMGDENYARIWREATSGSWQRKLPNGVSAALLNTHCLVDLSNTDALCRGAWLEFLPKAFRRSVTVLGKYFGKTKNELSEEFINPGTDRNADAIRRSIHLGLLECTAACDYAQNKAPLRRFILCARIPVTQLVHVKWGEPPLPVRYKKHDAIHRIEAILLDGAEFELFLNFRYVLSIPPDDMLLTPSITRLRFRMRSQVLTEIAARYATHTTRPGMYSFDSKLQRSGA